MPRIAVLATVLSSLLYGAAARAQAKFDKTQLEQFEALERMVLYHPHLYRAKHLEAFQSAAAGGSITKPRKANKPPG